MGKRDRFSEIIKQNTLSLTCCLRYNEWYENRTKKDTESNESVFNEVFNVQSEG